MLSTLSRSISRSAAVRSMAARSMSSDVYTYELAVKCKAHSKLCWWG
jgi:hypothetical protein